MLCTFSEYFSTRNSLTLFTVISSIIIIATILGVQSHSCSEGKGECTDVGVGDSGGNGCSNGVDSNSCCVGGSKGKGGVGDSNILGNGCSNSCVEGDECGQG